MRIRRFTALAATATLVLTVPLAGPAAAADPAGPTAPLFWGGGWAPLWAGLWGGGTPHATTRRSATAPSA